ncbi:ABC transporter permease [Oceanobacillus piezotolerans]|uniref:ABC transporter permease n=1 Tax=Oceanobacillus piezotolerans TaxID=2448030 RepID=A0A498D5S5_9BACI|nr:ABC transporter permease [Oceanobacillus piezotolerans]RLL45019.1 ABC transporter permease [Oceanobacillus piezotolerans]
MFDSNSLYKQRLSSHMKEIGRYMRYILNGHTAIAMLFLISALAYYYQGWVTQLPDNFPTSLIIGVVFGILVTYSPVRTLLKEPDVVFIITAEDKMTAYFRNAIIYSFFIQLYVILLIVAAFGPLYFAAYPERTGRIYLYTLIVILIFKIGNLLANWWMLKVRDQNVRRIDVAVRLLLNIAIFYFLVNGDMLFAAITTVIFGLVFLYDYTVSKKQICLNWGHLIEKDQQRMQAFYRLASMFAEVPHLRVKVRKRQWLVSLITDRVPLEKKQTYDYLYRITFVRSGDYIGMYVRLIIIGGLFIVFIPNLWMKLLFGILFLYLSIFQMMALYKHHRTIMWLDIYPVEAKEKKRALVTILYQLGLVQTVIFSVLFLFSQEYLGFILALGSGILFTFLFINGYVKGKLSK